MKIEKSLMIEIAEFVGTLASLLGTLMILGAAAFT
jgi:hypothetical protein